MANSQSLTDCHAVDLRSVTHIPNATNGDFREKHLLPPAECSGWYSLNPELKLPPKSDVTSSHFVFRRFLGRDSQTVINLVQSSQIKIACRSTYIQSAIPTVDVSQHSMAFLFPMTEGGTKSPIHLSSPIYLFPVHAERQKPTNFRLLLLRTGIEDDHGRP